MGYSIILCVFQAIYVKMMVKEAGMSFEPVISEMDLSYHSRYKASKYNYHFHSLR